MKTVSLFLSIFAIILSSYIAFSNRLLSNEIIKITNELRNAQENINANTNNIGNITKKVNNKAASNYPWLHNPSTKSILIEAGSSTEIVVPGNHIWTKSNVKIKEGNYIFFDAGGNVSPNRGSEWNDPNGVSGSISYNLYNVIDHAGLIGKIGKGGNVFGIGSRKIVPAKASGFLYLGINDNDIKNNEGAYDVDVKVCFTQNECK